MRINLRIVRKSIIYWGVILILVMFTDTLWIRNISSNRFFIIIGMGGIAAILAIFRCRKSNLKMVMYFIIPIILSMIVNADFDMLLFFKMALILICWAIVTKMDMQKIINYYISYTVFIAIFSLVCMIFRTTITSMSFIPTINSGSYGTKALFFTNVKIGIGNLYFLRNQGPFWEPGAYQAYLNIALMFLLFGNYKRKHKSVEMLILIVAVASTISTTGYFVLGLVILAKMVIRDNTSVLTKFATAALLLGVVLIALKNEAINYLLFDKMSLNSVNNISNVTRLYSVVQNGKGILRNPIFGVSPDKYSTLFTESSTVLGTVSIGVNTTTSLSVWALYGVAYFVIYNVGLIYFVKSFREKTLASILLIVAIFIIYNTENMNYSLFFTLIPFWGIYRKAGGLSEVSNNHDCV